MVQSAPWGIYQPLHWHYTLIQTAGRNIYWIHHTNTPSHNMHIGHCILASRFVLSNKKKTCKEHFYMTWQIPFRWYLVCLQERYINYTKKRWIKVDRREWFSTYVHNLIARIKQDWEEGHVPFKRLWTQCCLTKLPSVFCSSSTSEDATFS